MHPQPHESQHPDAETALDAAASAEIERALSALPLRGPSTALDARVAVALADASGAAPDEPAPASLPFPDNPPRRPRWLTGLAAAAVVALLAALGLTVYLGPGPSGTADGPGVVDNNPDTPGDVSTPPGGAARVVEAGYNFRPQPVDLHWTRDLDAGTLQTDNAQPMRAVRRQDVEQRVWVDTERGVTVQVTRPRERLMVVQQPTF